VKGRAGEDEVFGLEGGAKVVLVLAGVFGTEKRCGWVCVQSGVIGVVNGDTRSLGRYSCEGAAVLDEGVSDVLPKLFESASSS